MIAIAAAGITDHPPTIGMIVPVLSSRMADTVGDMPDSELQATLLDVERRGWDSLCDSTGAEFYGKIMTKDAPLGRRAHR